MEHSARNEKLAWTLILRYVYECRHAPRGALILTFGKLEMFDTMHLRLRATIPRMNREEAMLYKGGQDTHMIALR